MSRFPLEPFLALVQDACRVRKRYVPSSPVGSSPVVTRREQFAQRKSLRHQDRVVGAYAPVDANPFAALLATPLRGDAGAWRRFPRGLLLQAAAEGSLVRPFARGKPVVYFPNNRTVAEVMAGNISLSRGRMAQWIKDGNYTAVQDWTAETEQGYVRQVVRAAERVGQHDVVGSVPGCDTKRAYVELHSGEGIDTGGRAAGEDSGRTDAAISIGIGSLLSRFPEVAPALPPLPALVKLNKRTLPLVTTLVRFITYLD